MIILHVTDFHFNQRWFDWLLHLSPPHDLTVMSGDLLDRTSVTPRHHQIAWVSGWLSRYPRPLCVASGDHDLEWHDQTGRWMPAYWLRCIANPTLWTDSQRVTLNGASVLNIGRATQPKGGSADIWVVHAGPTKALTTSRASGGNGGDPDLASAIARYAPRLILSGRVHDPLRWRQHAGTTLLLNPGCAPQAETPNHILVRTTDLSCRFLGVHRGEVHAADPLAVFSPNTRRATAAAIA